MTKRRTAPEIIAFHFGWDIREVSETRYHPTRINSPSVYVISDDYYAAPADNKPPRHKVGKPWRELAEHYGRKIFVSEMETV